MNSSQPRLTQLHCLSAPERQNQDGRAVRHDAEAVLAFAQGRFGPLAVGDVLDQGVEPGHFAVFGPLRNVMDLHKSRPLRVGQLPLVKDRFTGERPLHVGPNQVVHFAADDVAEPLAQARSDRAAVPLFVGRIQELVALVAVDVGDQHGERIGDKPQLVLLLLQFGLRLLEPRNVVEGDDHALDAIVPRAIGEHFAEEPAAVERLHLPLDRPQRFRGRVARRAPGRPA